jgi:hypothetical protein
VDEQQDLAVGGRPPQKLAVRGSGGRRFARSSWPATWVGGTVTSTEASPSSGARPGPKNAPVTSDALRVEMMKT